MSNRKTGKNNQLTFEAYIRKGNLNFLNTSFTRSTDRQTTIFVHDRNLHQKQ